MIMDGIRARVWPVRSLARVPTPAASFTLANTSSHLYAGVDRATDVFGEKCEANAFKLLGVVAVVNWPSVTWLISRVRASFTGMSSHFPAGGEKAMDVLGENREAIPFAFAIVPPAPAGTLYGGRIGFSENRI